MRSLVLNDRLFPLVNTAREYLLAFFLSIVCFFLVFQVWSFEQWLLPFNYFGDTIFYAMTIKSVITTGWYLTDPSLGAPGGHCLVNFPTPECLNYLIIKVIALFTSNWVLVLNIFFLLGFPLITLSTLGVLRSLGLCYPFALTGSILFSFLPYHLIKEEYHLFLSGYYLIPLAAGLAIALYKNHLKKSTLFFYCLVCLLIGSNGIYYAYFSAFFILVGGIIASYRERLGQPLKYALFFIALISLSLAANLYKTIKFQWTHGAHYKVIERDPIETEQNGLKIAQLLLPRDGDRLFSDLKRSYNQHAVSVTENTSASLGLIGSLGFLYLLGALFLKRREENGDLTMDALKHFNLAALLLATMGGFASLISFFFLSEIRNYNRICVFIAFFALAGFFLLLQKRLKNQTLLEGVSLILLGVGLFNHSSSVDVPYVKLPEIAFEYENDKKFIRKIEHILPPESMIFQLPYIYFPEGPRGQINSYAHFKGPLHSHSLKWSFGAMRGGEVDRWQEKISQSPVPEMIHELVKQGFTGLYIDKFGYLDEARAITEQLRKLVKTPPTYDKHGRSFWDLRLVSLPDANFQPIKDEVFTHLANSWCSTKKAELIMDLIFTNRPQVCVEIGAFTGSSVLPAAATLKYLGKGHLYAIDAWSNEEAVKGVNMRDPNYAWWLQLDMLEIKTQFESLINQWELSFYCSIIHAPSETAINQIQEIDFLHLDGNMSEEGSLLDLQLFFPKVKSGGYVLLSNAFLIVDGNHTKMSSIWKLFDGCELISEIDGGNTLLFRKN